MMISQTAEHALRAMLFLARHDDAAVPASDIARAIDAPANYLGKTLQVLARHGFVSSARGPNGGFRIMLDPAQMTVADVVAVFADAPRHRPCLLGGRACSEVNACAAHHRWTDMRSAVDEVLHETTIADLLGNHAGNEFDNSSHPAARVAV